MCARCEQLEAENLDLRTMLGVTEDDKIGETIWRAYGLTRSELRLVLLMYARRGGLTSRWALIATLDKGYDSSGSLKVHVSHMRRKLGEGSISVEPGVGYRLAPALVEAFDRLTGRAMARAA